MTAGAPVYVPWHEHKGEPRFICDVMTEGLAKQLRLYGVDAAAVESQGKGSRHLVYRSASPCPLPDHCPLPYHCPLPLNIALCLAIAVSPSIAPPCLLPPGAACLVLIIVLRASGLSRDPEWRPGARQSQVHSIVQHVTAAVCCRTLHYLLQQPSALVQRCRMRQHRICILLMILLICTTLVHPL